MTTAQACVRGLLVAALLPGRPVGVGTEPGFRPASRIGGQPLPRGRRISLIHHSGGESHPTSSIKLSRWITPSSPAFPPDPTAVRSRFRQNVSQLLDHLG